MKKVTISLFITILFSFQTTTIFAQSFIPIDSLGWGGGMSYPKPCVYDIDGDGLKDILIGAENGYVLHYEIYEEGCDSIILITRQFNDINENDMAAPTIADIDQDNLLDLLIAGDFHISHYEQVSENSYDFTLVNGNFLGLNDLYFVPVFANVDGDDNLDLLIGSFTNQLAYYEQTQPGVNNWNLITSFFGSIIVESNSSFTIHDIDGNGKLDILACYNAKISRYEQVVAGSLNYEQITSDFLPIEDSWYLAPVICNFNEDEFLDLLVAHDNGTINLFKQNPGTSTVFDLESTNFLSYYVGTKPAIDYSDIDNDGLIDLIIGNSQGNLFLLEQNTVGSLQFNQISPNFLNVNVGYLSYPECVDIDNDGLLDILIGNSSGDLYHYKQVSPNSYNFEFITENFNNINLGTSYSSPKIVDIDDDGLKDLIAGVDFGGMYLRYEQDASNSLDFNLIPGGIIGLNNSYNSKFEYLDINSDGKRDAFCDHNGDLRHYEEALPGSMDFILAAENFNGINEENYCHPAFYDLDDNGRLDLLLSTESGQIKHYVQQEDDSTQFLSSAYNFTGEIDAGITVTPCLCDLNDDGLFEMIVGKKAGKLSLYVQEAVNSYKFNLQTTNFCDIYQYPYSYAAPTITDLDSNGLKDMFIGMGNRILRYEQTSFDPFSFEQLSDNFGSIFVEGQAKPYFYDIDKDGLLDLLIGSTNGKIYYYKQDLPYSTYFSPVTESFNNIDVGDNSSPIITDLDNDNLLDLLVGCEYGQIYRYEQSSVNSLDFTYITNNLTGIETDGNTSPSAADITGDGLIDLVIGKETGGINLFIQDETTNISNHNRMVLEHLLITPNPAKDKILFLTDKKIVNVQIRDITGNCVIDAYNNNKTISVSDLKSGLYLVLIRFTDHSITRKIVVSH